MGVINVLFGDVAKVPCYFLLSTYFYRVRDSAPDGSSPRGYSRNFLGIGSREWINLLHTLLLVSFADFAHF
jgi:hypothetical protein